MIRLLVLSKHGVFPSGLVESIKERAPNFSKWAEAVAAHPSVTKVFDETAVVEGTKAKIAQIRAAKA